MMKYQLIYHGSRSELIMGTFPTKKAAKEEKKSPRYDLDAPILYPKDSATMT